MNNWACRSLSGLLLLVSFAAMGQNLSLTLASQIPQPGLVTTRSADSLVLNAVSGSRVSFARQSGSDYRLQANGGFFWAQVQELPRDATSVAVTPTLLDDGSILVSVDVMQKNNDRQNNYSSTILAQPGEWVQLMGPSPSQQRGVKTYGTQQAAGDSLFLLVEPERR